MTTVRISYDPDLSKIGTIREVDPAEARRLVNRGRATYVRKELASVADTCMVSSGAPVVDVITDAVAVTQDQQDEADGVLLAGGTSLDLDDDED